MASPCIITYKGKEYSYEEWAAELHDGLLDTLVKEGTVSLEKKEPTKAEEREREKRRFTKQFVKEYPDLEPALKEDVVYYDRLPNSISVSEANAVIDYLGVDEATKAFKDLTNGMPLPVRMTVGQILIKKFESEGEYDKAIDTLEEVTTRATELGQGIQVMSMFPNLSPEGQLRKAQREVNAQVERLKKKVKPKIDAISKDMGEVNKVAVEQAIKNVKPKIEQTDKIKPSEQPQPKGYGESNIIVSKDRYKAAKRALKGKAFSGLPPELIDVAVYHMEATGRQFTEFAKKMVQDFGAKVKPHLQKLYEKGKQRMIENGYQADDFVNDADLTKEIKSALKEEGKSVEEIVRQHYTVYDKTKQSLTDKLIEKAGLDPREAKDFANVVQKEFDRIATQKKKELLAKQFSKREKIAKKKEVQGLEDEIIKLTNLGAFEDAEITKAYAEKMGWPKLTSKDVKEIKRLADIVQQAPPGLRRFKATEDLLKYQANLQGLDKMDIALSIWYANILSGYNTQEVNFASGMFNAMAEYAVAVAQNPKRGKYLANGFINGVKRGILEAGSTLKTGYSPIRGKAEIPPTLERVRFKGGNINPANYLKYVRRAMVATDVLFFEGLKEMRAYEFANMLAAKDNQLDPNIDQKIRAAQYLGKTDEILQGAIEKAQAEYEIEIGRIEQSGTAETREKRKKEAELDRKRRIYEIIEEARTQEILTESQSFAARGTYNYKPEGVLGWMANGLNQAGNSFPPFKLIVPFTNIIANVANESMNYTPWGFARAMANGSVSGTFVNEKLLRKDFETMTQKQLDRAKADLMTKAILGTTAMTALYILSQKWDDDDEPFVQITANGTGDYKKNYQLQETGWQPYSIKIGNTWYSYQNSPFIIPLSFIGNIRDFETYRKEKITDDGLSTKIGAAATASSRTLMDMTFVKNLNTFINSLSNAQKENVTEDVAKAMLNTGKGFVVPNLYLQAQKDIQNIFDIPTKEATSLTGSLLRDFPIARNMYYDKLNVLGEPVVSDTDKLYSRSVNDPLFQLIADKNAFISPTSIRKITVYDDKIKAERLLTDEEFYNYSKIRGEHIKKYLENNLETLKKLPKEEVQKRIKAETERATKTAKNAITP